MDKEYVFTEDPNAEIWQNILQFSYEANIKRYLTEHSFMHSEELINNISVLYYRHMNITALLKK